MKKMIFALMFVFLLAGCDQTFKCTKDDDVLKYTFNDEELVSVTRNGEDVGAIEFAAQKIAYLAVGAEEYEDSIANFNSKLGYVCK